MKVTWLWEILALLMLWLQVPARAEPLTRDPFTPVIQKPKFKSSHAQRKQPEHPHSKNVLANPKSASLVKKVEPISGCPKGWRYLGNMTVNHQLQALLEQKQHVLQFFQGQQIAGTAWKIHLIGSEQVMLASAQQKSLCVLKRWSSSS
ncbi:hypothetical protein [Celerinatantimonas sp. MCCC 1A17872]|uniref:hypothetical protein n=1 Tax=Celerinatantimonas sp. MCCC 1A17872 TaxID=3177514 RepID=UPI0038C4AD66